MAPPTLHLPPLSLYVHIPWCVRKCPYCDFNSHAAGDSLPEADYLRCLLQDLQTEAAHAQGRKLGSIFFGGGTPSLFSAGAIGRIIERAEALIGFAEDVEITLEANPGTAEQGRFRAYRAAGVNRLSLGIQSLNDAHLQALGRIHDSRAGATAVTAARAAGFDNLNLDLMHGLPRQTPTEAMADLAGVLALAPEHISWYQLTLEPNTVFYRQPPALPDDDTLAEIEERGFELLAAAGYRRYEISAFSRFGRESRHNTNYWEFGDYLGIGAGAHGKLSDPAAGRVRRRRKTRMPAHYLAATTAPDWRDIAAAELPLEFMLNALRLAEGVPARYFVERTGLQLAAIDGQLTHLRARGLMAEAPHTLATTALGQRFLNDVLAVFEADSQPLQWR